MEIPGLGGLKLRELVKRAVKHFLADDMTSYAAALSYHTLIALFSFAIFLLALLSALGLTEFFDWLLEQAVTAFPDEAYESVEQAIEQVRDQAQGGLLSIGIGAALWAASAAVRSLMNALNAAYEAYENRPAWKRYPLSLLYTIGLAAMFISAAGLMLLGPRAVEWIADQAGFAETAVTIWTWLRWPLAIILLTVALAITYQVAPNVNKPFHLVSAGAVFTVIAWVVAAIGFTTYLANFGNYDEIYGGLGGVVVLLLYFFITAGTLLFGGEINAVIYRAQKGETSNKTGDGGPVGAQ